MTIALALEYIPRRMKELGYGVNYYLRFRHMVLQPKEKTEIDACNQLYILVEQKKGLSISSDFGLFDMADNSTNEQTYEHQGILQINNYSNRINHLRFIQVIPQTKTDFKNN